MSNNRELRLTALNGPVTRSIPIPDYRELRLAVDAARTGEVTLVAYASTPFAAVVPVDVAERGSRAEDSAYDNPSELVIRVQTRLGEPEEVALALEKMANRIREAGDVRAATGYDMAGGFRDSQGNNMGTTEVR